MSEYKFRAVFRAPVIEDLDEYAEALEVGSCDDALAGISDTGLIELDFEREELSAEAAMRSAIVDVMAAIPTAKFIEVAPDYVGISEIARIVGVSRQHIRRLWVDDQYSAPQPIHQSTSAVWRFAAVLPWLNTQMEIEDYASLLDVAEASVSVNNSLQSCSKFESKKASIERYTPDGAKLSINNYQVVRYENSVPIDEGKPTYRALYPALKIA